jgi:hypothetical protein
MRIKPRIVCLAGLSLGLVAGQAASGEVAAVVAEPQLVGAARTVDLRPKFEEWGLRPRSQGNRPTCSVFAIAGALEFAMASGRQPGERLSVEFLNWSANQTGRRARDGGFFSELWDGFASHGICAEKEMPYQSEFDPTRSPATDIQAIAKKQLALGLQLHWLKKWNVNTGLRPDEFAAIKQTLDQGWPVAGGLRWPKQDKWENDVLQMCPAAEVFDGHSVLLVGYWDDANQPGGGVFIFRNSNRGARDGYMPYQYAQTYMNDAVWIESKGQTTLLQPNSH